MLSASKEKHPKVPSPLWLSLTACLPQNSDNCGNVDQRQCNDELLFFRRRPFGECRPSPPTAQSGFGPKIPEQPFSSPCVGREAPSAGDLIEPGSRMGLVWYYHTGEFIKVVLVLCIDRRRRGICHQRVNSGPGSELALCTLMFHQRWFLTSYIISIFRHESVSSTYPGQSLSKSVSETSQSVKTTLWWPTWWPTWKWTRRLTWRLKKKIGQHGVG